MAFGKNFVFFANCFPSPLSGGFCRRTNGSPVTGLLFGIGNLLKCLCVCAGSLFYTLSVCCHALLTDAELPHTKKDSRLDRSCLSNRFWASA